MSRRRQRAPEHIAFVTLGEPWDDGVRPAAPRWRGACVCGWRGDSLRGEEAQADALSHVAGHPVRPVKVRKVSTWHSGAKVPAGRGYGVY